MTDATKTPIALESRLVDGARVLEIGSGTGEHAVAVCQRRPDIVWQPSDPDAASRASQDAWAAEAAPNMLPALDLDLTRPEAAEQLGRFDALVCLNVIHIAPWTVAEAIANASQALIADDGLIYLYGPYLEGEATAASNLEFDRSLKSRNPSWGVRARSDVEALFAASGWARPQRHEMPANNLSLVFDRRSPI